MRDFNPPFRRRTPGGSFANWRRRPQTAAAPALAMPSASPRSAADTSAHDARFLDGDFPWRRAEGLGDESLSPRCAASGWTDEAVDFEALAYMAATEYDESTFGLSRRASREMSVSGLPLVCSNCGVSFFSLQITDDQVDCYCSGECKWSVIMYREMDRRLCALRPRAPSASAGSTYDSSCSATSFHPSLDDVISCR